MASQSKFFLRDEEALLKEIRFSRKMSDKTGKVVHLKQAKEEKPRSKVKDIPGKMIPSIKL